MTDKTAVSQPKISRERLSKCGKWRSFPKTPGLLQYISTGVYFARVRVKGKLFRRSLDTTIFTTAKEKLPDFRKDHQTKQFPEGTFGDALSKYEWGIENDPGLSPFTKRYRKACIAKLLASWVGLKDEKLKDISPDACKAEFRKLWSAIDAQYYNNILGTFRAVLKKVAIDPRHDPSRGDDPIKRQGVIIQSEEVPESVLPTLVNYLQKSSAWRHHEAARVVRFLAFSGCRISEAQGVTWNDIDLAGGFITVRNAKTRAYRNRAEFRRVPIIPPMRELLEEIIKAKPGRSGSVLPFGECYGSLRKACKDLNIPPLTHHTFRGWFASRAIEKGVDVPTVSEWCGHSDGGALLLKRYRKASKEHSLKMAEKFTMSGSAQ